MAAMMAGRIPAPAAALASSSAPLPASPAKCGCASLPFRSQSPSGDSTSAAAGFGCGSGSRFEQVGGFGSATNPRLEPVLGFSFGRNSWFERVGGISYASNSRFGRVAGVGSARNARFGTPVGFGSARNLGFEEVGESGSASNSGFESVGRVNSAGRSRGKSSRRLGRRGSRVVQNCAGSRDEPESSEPGPSGADGGDKDEEELDLEASFRMKTTDWRAFRARLVKGANNSLDAKTDEDPRRWAHALVEPEKGCLLIAHPTAFGSRQTYFNQAVIFLFEHDEDGSAGFILNRPTSYALGQVPGFEKFKPDFTESPLYMGGDVGTNLIQVMHGVAGLQDSKEVINGVYLGGPDAVNQSVKNGETVPNNYRWFLGYCGWRPGQLEREVAHGVWYLASGSRDIVTNQCIRLKRPLWRQVLELMGGEYSLISKRAYGEI